MATKVPILRQDSVVGKCLTYFDPNYIAISQHSSFKYITMINGDEKYHFTCRPDSRITKNNYLGLSKANRQLLGIERDQHVDVEPFQPSARIEEITLEVSFHGTRTGEDLDYLDVSELLPKFQEFEGRFFTKDEKLAMVIQDDQFELKVKAIKTSPPKQLGGILQPRYDVIFQTKEQSPVVRQQSFGAKELSNRSESTNESLQLIAAPGETEENAVSSLRTAIQPSYRVVSTCTTSRESQYSIRQSILATRRKHQQVSKTPTSTDICRQATDEGKGKGNKILPSDLPKQMGFTEAEETKHSISDNGTSSGRNFLYPNSVKHFIPTYTGENSATRLSGEPQDFVDPRHVSSKLEQVVRKFLIHFPSDAQKQVHFAEFEDDVWHACTSDPNISQFLRHTQTSGGYLNNQRLPTPFLTSSVQLAGQPITASEVKEALRDLYIPNAPGSNGLLCGLWQSLDPKGEILPQIFEICWKSRQIPTFWRDLKDLDNDAMYDRWRWHPAAISSAFYRLYVSVIASRLLSWAFQKNLIPQSQEKSALEHFFKMEWIIANSKFEGCNLYLAFLDGTDGFESLRPEYVLDVLQLFNAPTDLFQVVCDIYSSAQGLLPGCPLTHIAVNLIVGRLIYELKQLVDSVAPIQVNGGHVALLASSQEQLKPQLDLCDQFTRQCGMGFNCAESAILVSTSPKNQMAIDSFCLGDKKVGAVPHMDLWPFLVKQIGCPATERIKIYIERLFALKITSFEKLSILKGFVLPKLFSQLGLKLFVRDAGNLDIVIRRIVEHEFELRIPCTPFMHSATDVGGLGIQSLANEGDVTRIALSFETLNSKNPDVRDVAHSRLNMFSTDPVAQIGYLNKERSRNDAKRRKTPGGFWSGVCSSSQRLGIRWLTSGGDFQISANGNICQSIERVSEFLHQLVNLQWKKEWACLPDQGKTVNSQSRYKISSHFLSDPTQLQERDIKWVLNARLNLLPLRSTRKRSKPKHYALPTVCRMCGESSETLPHILNCCQKVASYIHDRHDLIVDLIANIPTGFIKRDIADVCRGYADQTGKILTPDLIFEHCRDGHLVVVEITVPFDTGLTAAVSRKRNKYRELCDFICKSTKKPVQLHTFVVGSLGSFAVESFATLHALGLSYQKAEEIGKKSVILAIDGSYTVWKAWNDLLATS